MKIGDMKRRYCMDGWQYAMATMRFTGFSSVTMTRGRYRGKNTLKPWNQQPSNAGISVE